MVDITQRSIALQTRGTADFDQSSNPQVGRLRIAGTVTIEGEPAQRTVVLMRRGSFVVARHKISKADGSYAFGSLPFGRYTVIALDRFGNEFEAVVADRVEPVSDNEGE